MGHGGQGVEQRLETMDGPARVGPLGAGVALGSRGPLRGRHHGGSPGRAGGLIVILAQERGQRLAPGPLDVIRAQAEEDLGAPPLAHPVPKRADGAGHGLQAPPGARHGRQTHIRADGTLGGEGLSRHTRADPRDPSECRVRREALQSAGRPQRRLGARDLAVRAHRATLPSRRDPPGDASLAWEPAWGARGRLEEGLSLPGPLAGPQGVTTGAQALLGLGRSGASQPLGLCQACQGERAGRHELLDSRAPEGAHPGEAGHGWQLSAHARVAEQAPVTPQDHPLQRKRAAPLEGVQLTV